MFHGVKDNGLAMFAVRDGASLCVDKACRGGRTTRIEPLPPVYSPTGNVLMKHRYSLVTFAETELKIPALVEYPAFLYAVKGWCSQFNHFARVSNEECLLMRHT